MIQTSLPSPPGRRWVLIAGGAALALAGAGAAGWDHVTRAASPGSDGAMTPGEALAGVRSGRLVLIDIRRSDEWAATGVPEGAAPIDLRRPDFAEAVRAAAGDPPRPVALICARGVRSRRTAAALSAAGVTDVRDVPEGMLGSDAGPGWLARGLPVVAWGDLS